MSQISYKEKWKALGPPQLASTPSTPQQPIKWTLASSSRRGNWDRYDFQLHPPFDSFFATVWNNYKTAGIDVMTEPGAQRPVRWGYVPNYNVQVIQAKLDHRGKLFDRQLYQVFQETTRQGQSPYAPSSAPWVVGPGGKVGAVGSGEREASETPVRSRGYGTPDSALS
ncbi:uncharacterized protein BDZ99DRAFT_564691 [Mytilinidion resinicola]|uniref:Uncharacterized protein n=1 Tax=Mytilinidion resinicola TaxID=574789 RepID=A0A6A6Z6Y7_9PEZI|nr:uncharacterized protein BDZ99DRAFT_564691 [Mytilinidion resinicola]KAF2816861.1 hypothetical protein BDZ99DRAFT_564691 [Mytilinidion resinicola]